MTDSNGFVADSCFWYYIVITVVLLFIGWTAILIAYPNADPIVGKDKSELGWPANLNMWSYSVHSLIPYVIWTAGLLLFMWGAYHADCRDIPGEIVLLYRLAYIIILILVILSLFLFYIQHNIVGALVANIFSLILIIGLIMLYSDVDTNDAWFAFPYLVITCYFVYFTLYSWKMNQHNPDVRNFLFEL